MIRTYSELISIPTFEERLAYLKLDGRIGEDTFGFDRIFNQRFYHSNEWKSIRDRIIVRDCGNDLGVDGFQVFGNCIVHHMNPIRLDDILEVSDYLMNPEFLITTSLQTHNAIHYGDLSQHQKSPVLERTPNDTCPWKN